MKSLRARRTVRACPILARTPRNAPNAAPARPIVLRPSENLRLHSIA